jgi:hypothetical protein
MRCFFGAAFGGLRNGGGALQGRRGPGTRNEQRGPIVQLGIWANREGRSWRENESLRVRELTPEQAPRGARVYVTGVRREPGLRWATSSDARRLLGRRGTVRHLLYAGSEHAELDVAWDEPEHWLMLAPLDTIQIEGGGTRRSMTARSASPRRASRR